MKVMQNKLDASVQDIDSNIKKTMEARLEDLTRDVFREMNKIQQEMYQALAIEGKKALEETNQQFRKMKKEMEEMLLPIIKKSTATEEMESMIKVEVQRLVKVQLAGTTTKNTVELQNEELIIETIRSDYLTKMLELEQTFKDEQEQIRNKMKEEQKVIRGELREIVTTTKEIILSKFEEVQTLITTHPENTRIAPTDHEDRITQLEALISLQQEELLKMEKHLKSAQESKFNNSASGIDVQSVNKILNEKFQVLENRMRTETSMFRTENKLSSLEDKLGKLDIKLEEMERSTLSTPGKPSSPNRRGEERLRKLEEDLQNKHHQSLKAIEARNAAYQDRLEKKLGDILHRINMVEDTLKAESETSIQALQALLND